LQQLANPFASDNTIGGLFAGQASGDYNNPNASDQVIVWNPSTQAYTVYVYLDASGTYGPSYASYDGWQEYSQFQSANYADDTNIPLGQGFWYKAVSGFDWAVSNNYYSAVQ
jgi:hypothetical protein